MSDIAPVTQLHDVPSVVTVTPAPAIDRLIRVSELKSDSVHRAAAATLSLGGNGLNLARALRSAHIPATAVAPLNLERDAELAHPEACFVSTASRTRVNTIIAEADGTTTNFNEPAPPLANSEWRELFTAADDTIRKTSASWLVVGGTMPERHPDAATWGELAHRADAKLCLDLPGTLLGDWVRAGARPDLIAPNIDELREATGRTLPTLGAAVDGAYELIRQGVKAVLLTLGAFGALYITSTTQLWARTAPASVVNTTGAGDATLAGFLSASDHPHEALRRAVQWGRAAVETTASVIDPQAISPQPVEITEPLYPLQLTPTEARMRGFGRPTHKIAAS
ncbi:MAG: 1-phosphofructokinase family hexose kinase [Canibacter sp.]